MPRVGHEVIVEFIEGDPDRPIITGRVYNGTNAPPFGMPDGATKSGILSRHRHPMIVVGYVIKGRWKYLEHDWTADEGSFVYEPPGEIHTLTVPEDCPEMITFFNISGAMIYVDADGRQNGYEDVWSKIDVCRDYYAQVGLGAQYAEQFIR